VLDDLRLAVRNLAKHPGFSSVAIVTLALGIGASTAMFSVVNGVLLRALPYPKPDRLMQVETVFRGGSNGRVSYPNFEDVREETQSFDGLAAYADWTTSAAVGGRGFRVNWAQVSADFFPVVGVDPVIGRAFSAEELATGQRVAVVSYGYWQSRLAATASLVSHTLRANNEVYAIIGVMPRGYQFPAGTEVWVPREPADEGRTAHNWSVVGRLRDGVSRAQAQQEISMVARRLAQRYGPDTAMADAIISPLLDRIVEQVRPALLLLLGGAGVLLLVACVNAANLLLTRAVVRDRESAVRLALGARPSHLARGFLAESLVMSLAGATLGVLVAIAGVSALLTLEPARLPRIENIGVDWRVLAFTFMVSVIVALAVGLVPAGRAARRDMRDALTSSQRLHGVVSASRWLHGCLVVAQIALTVVLLVAAGLLGRSFMKLLEVDPGFRAHGALVMDVWLPLSRDVADQIRIADFLDGVMAGMRTLPGVERVAGANHLPLQGGGPSGTFVILERPDDIANFDEFSRLAKEPERSGNADFRVASASYFETLQIPLLRGRVFDERDSREAPHVAVISAALAQTRWPADDPLGKLIQFGNMDGDLTPFTIVGIVADVQDYGIGVQPRGTFYTDYRQRPTTAFTFSVVVQGMLDDAAMIAAARRVANEIDADVPVAFRAFDDLVSGSLADRRFLLLIVSVFGIVALALAAMGVYGVIAYLAVQRKPELGLRVALGARGRDVVSLLVRQGALFAMVGIGVGMLTSFALARVLASFLYGVGAFDPLTLGAVAAVLLAIALVASFVPAYRASIVGPLEALRQE
jgi:putative ABC transport system permease protein